MQQDLTVQKFGWQAAIDQFIHSHFERSVSSVSSLKPICTANLVAWSPARMLWWVWLRTARATLAACFTRRRLATAPTFEVSLRK